ncbi:MAG: TIM barrel protein [Candidatus Woesearchaeota archaeon]
MILLGPGGTAGLGYDKGLGKIHELGLSAMEVEFTYGVRMSNEEALRVGKLAKGYGIALSVHGPYYINLASNKKNIITASKKRILDSCERAHHLGARYVVFHAGFYQGAKKEDVYRQMAQGLQELSDIIKSKGWKTTLAPELTGKATQFGDVDELMQLKQDTGCHMTIDFSHWKARSLGKMGYSEMLDKLKQLKHVHSHFSGIEFTEKGERRHLLTDKNEMKSLLQEITKRKTDITIINESPDPIGDSQKMLTVLGSLGR